MPRENSRRISHLLLQKEKREVLSMGFTKGMETFGCFIYIFIFCLFAESPLVKEMSSLSV